MPAMEVSPARAAGSPGLPGTAAREPAGGHAARPGREEQREDTAPVETRW